MTNPNQSSAKSLAELRAQRKRAEVRKKAQDKKQGQEVRKRYKNKKSK